MTVGGIVFHTSTSALVISTACALCVLIHPKCAGQEFPDVLALFAQTVIASANNFLGLSENGGEKHKSSVSSIQYFRHLPM